MKTYILILTILLTSTCFGQKIKIKHKDGNKWVKTLSASDISQAGSDYNTFYESKTNQTEINISKNKKNKEIEVKIHKENINWNPKLKIRVRRTDTGQAYQNIFNNFPQPFIKTSGDQKIKIQYQISGLSVLIPVDNYSTEIIYTIMDY